MNIHVYVNIMQESHRTTHWVTFENPHGETTTPHYFEERERAVYTAAEYAFFFRDMESYEALKKELEVIDPLMFSMLQIQEKTLRNKNGT